MLEQTNLILAYSQNPDPQKELLARMKGLRFTSKTLSQDTLGVPARVCTFRRERENTSPDLAFSVSFGGAEDGGNSPEWPSRGGMKAAQGEGFSTEKRGRSTPAQRGFFGWDRHVENCKRHKLDGVAENITNLSFSAFEHCSGESDLTAENNTLSNNMAAGESSSRTSSLEDGCTLSLQAGAAVHDQINGNVRDNDYHRDDHLEEQKEIGTEESISRVDHNGDRQQLRPDKLDEEEDWLQLRLGSRSSQYFSPEKSEDASSIEQQARYTTLQLLPQKAENSNSSWIGHCHRTGKLLPFVDRRAGTDHPSALSTSTANLDKSYDQLYANVPSQLSYTSLVAGSTLYRNHADETSSFSHPQHIPYTQQRAGASDSTSLPRAALGNKNFSQTAMHHNPCLPKPPELGWQQLITSPTIWPTFHYLQEPAPANSLSWENNIKFSTTEAPPVLSMQLQQRSIADKWSPSSAAAAFPFAETTRTSSPFPPYEYASESVSCSMYKQGLSSTRPPAWLIPQTLKGGPSTDSMDIQSQRSFYELPPLVRANSQIALNNIFVPRPKLIAHPQRGPPGFWFLLQAGSDNDAHYDRPPPRIVKSYLRIKDGEMPISAVKKYLVAKLGLSSQSEVEITCRGKAVVDHATLRGVRDECWSPAAASDFEAKEASRFRCTSPSPSPSSVSPSKNHIMVLTYHVNASAHPPTSTLICDTPS